jgi:hypothetical protein
MRDGQASRTAGIPNIPGKAHRRASAAGAEAVVGDELAPGPADARHRGPYLEPGQDPADWLQNGSQLQISTVRAETHHRQRPTRDVDRGSS